MRKSVFKSFVLLIVFAFLMGAGYGEFEDSISADESPVIKVESKEGQKGEEIWVQVVTENTAGMAGGKVVLDYDSEMMEIKELETGELLADGLTVTNKDYGDESLAVVWGGARGIEDDGVLANIKVNLQEDGETSFQFGEISITDVGGESISAEGVEGEVVVSDNDIEEDPEETENDVEDPDEVEDPVEPDEPEEVDEPETDDVNDEEEPDPQVDEEEADEEEEEEKDEEVKEALETGEPYLRVTNAEGELEETVHVQLEGYNIGDFSGNVVLAYDSEMVEPEEIVDTLPENYMMESNLEYDHESMAIAWFGLAEEEGDAQLDIAEISLKLLEEGESELEFASLMLVDEAGEEISVETSGGTIICGTTGLQLFDWGEYTLLYLIIIIAVIAIAVILLVRKYKTDKGEQLPE